ncbi:hypothetical protein M153_3040003, partial [Pseudoloma neurophilia]
ISLYLRQNPIKLGGLGVVVHVDGTMLNYKVKAQRGRSQTRQICEIFLVDTSTKPSKRYAEIVAYQTSSTLLEVIERVIRPGSIIHTDEWAAYSTLRRSNQFEHRTVCHEYHFIDPSTGVHIQNVKIYNNKIKKNIEKCKWMLRQQKKQNFFKRSFLMILLKIIYAKSICICLLVSIFSKFYFSFFVTEGILGMVR